MVVVFQGEKTSHVKIGYSKLFKNLRGRVSKTFKIHQKYCVGQYKKNAKNYIE